MRFLFFEVLFLSKVKITGMWLRRVCNGTWVFMEHFLVLCCVSVFCARAPSACFSILLEQMVEPSTTCGTAVFSVFLNSDAVFDTVLQ